MVTGVDDPDIAHEAVLHGAHGYLVKPFSMNELLINVDAALHHRDRHGGSGYGPSAEEHRVAEVRGALIRLDTEAHLADRQAVELLWPLSEAVGRRDLETGGHIRRIGESSALLAHECGLSEADTEGIRLAAPMHDVGKVAIPDSVLLKPGPLEERERELVQRHAEIGHDILARSTSRVLKLAAEIALTHHERMDGTGYPHGLAGEDVPIAGRIVAVADVYDALTNNRPYRSALSSDEAVEIMRAERGTHLDPELLDLFLGRLGDVQRIGRAFADHSVAA
jgi:putative two-component system response regulator